MAKRRGKKKAGAGRTRKRTKAASAPGPFLPGPLPDHLMEDNFLRLPPKSLAASRCVSPSWNHLFSSPAFVRLYDKAKAAEATSDPVRFVSVPSSADEHKHLRVTADTAGDDVPLYLLCEGCPRVFCVAGMPCHGMVLAGWPCQGDFFVCNTSTGGVLRIPPRRPPLYFYSAGLGYDGVTGRHKAVLLEVVRRTMILKLRYSVFTVGDRQWRWRAPRGNRTPIVFKGAQVSAEMDPVFADGRLHWKLSKRTLNVSHDDDIDGILAFVLSGEFFRRIPLPTFANGGSKLKWPVHGTLAELDGRLCLVRDLRSRKRAVALFEVWMLHDIMSESWSLDRRIDLSPQLCEESMPPWDVFVLCYVGDESAGQNRKILLATTAQRAYMYEPDTVELRTVAMSCAQSHMRLVLYQESLVQVAGMEYDKQEIEFKFSTDESGF